ncbi:NAD(P)/FAD-dependent oxidoreductase [Pseudoneobacillus sp. C159]
MNKPKVVILGAGYGGLITSKKLAKLLKSGEADITLINKHDYHYITTQLHKTGVGTACDERITMRVEDLIDRQKIHFKRGNVTFINLADQSINLDSDEKVFYDYLLIALGFGIETFGIPGIKEHAFEIRSFRSTKKIFHHIQRQLLAYKEDQDPSRLNFAVAGAGFTGIEMLGELVAGLPALCKATGVPYEITRIISVEASPTLLPGFEQEAIDFSTNLLKQQGVELLTSTKISQYDGINIKIVNGNNIPARTLIWSCGVKGNELMEKLGIPTVQSRIVVDKDLRVPGYPNVFCIGDSSMFLKDEQTAYPPTAQIAIQQALICGENIVATIRGQQLKTFEYHHKGTVASIGDYAAVGKVGNFTIKGTFAALMKQIIEMRYLLVLGGPALLFKQTFKRFHAAPTKVIAKH